MKAFTDLEQSKKLAEFLPIESADMNWHELPSIGLFVRAFPYKQNKGATEGLFPCWSLAALLKIIPKCIGDYNIFRMDINDIDTSMWYDKIGYGVYNKLPDITMEEPIDACVELIEKLHGLKIL